MSLLVVQLCATDRMRLLHWTDDDFLDPDGEGWRRYPLDCSFAHRYEGREGSTRPLCSGAWEDQVYDRDVEAWVGLGTWHAPATWVREHTDRADPPWVKRSWRLCDYHARGVLTQYGDPHDPPTFHVEHPDA